MLLVWPAVAWMGQHRDPMDGGVFSHMYFYQSEQLSIRVYSQLQSYISRWFPTQVFH